MQRSLLFRSLFVLSLVTALSTPVLAQENNTEVDALPVTFTDESVSVVEGNTAFIRLTAEEVQETTRVRVRITPDTARSGTDYRNPGIVTVTFYKNGLTNKRIGVRTVNRSGAQNTRSFTASIISINGKAIAADDAEILEVTITDRSAVTTTPPRTTTGTTVTTGVVDTKPGSGTVAGGTTGTTGSTPTVTQPRCVAGNSVARFAVAPTSVNVGTGWTSQVGQAYHMPFTFPARWWEKIPRAPNTNFSPGGSEAYARMGNTYPLVMWAATDRIDCADGCENRPGSLDIDVSVSECPGDFNPQTACVGKGAASFGNAVYQPSSSRDLVAVPTYFGQVNCELQGGKQYYLNTRINECFGSSLCIHRTDGRSSPIMLYDGRLLTQ
jgi:hypothetical protein